MKKVAIIMGSDSDRPIVDKTAETLSNFGVEDEMHVYSAHRTPKETTDFALSAEQTASA